MKKIIDEMREWEWKSVFGLGVPIGATVFMGWYLKIYAFDNPDPKNCWHVKGTDISAPSRE